MKNVQERMRTKTSIPSNAHQAVAAKLKLEKAGANVSDLQLCAEGQRYWIRSIVHGRGGLLYQ